MELVSLAELLGIFLLGEVLSWEHRKTIATANRMALGWISRICTDIEGWKIRIAGLFVPQELSERIWVTICLARRILFNLFL